MTKFGVNALIWTTDVNTFDPRVLEQISDSGFSAFEVPLFRPSDIDVKRIRRLLDANGLACTVCCILPSGLNPISADKTVRRATVEHLRACIDRTAELGAALMGGPVYAPIGYLPGRRRTGEEWSYAVECFASLAPCLEANGVTLALEPLNRFETFFLNTVDDASRLCAEIDSPHVGVLLDTFHLNIEEKNIPAAFHRAGPYLRHIHAGENDRGIAGTGHVDFSGIFRELMKMDYNGYVVIESFGFWQNELAAAAAIWRDLAPTPESVAFEGIENLKRLALTARAESLTV